MRDRAILRTIYHREEAFRRGVHDQDHPVNLFFGENSRQAIHAQDGRVPFEGKNPSEVMHKHLKAPLTPPDHVNPALSAHVAEVIEMMMAKTVEDRYLRAADLIEDLELIAAGKPPHFAHRELSLAEMPSTESVIADMPNQPTITRASAPSAVQSPVFMFMLILLTISVIANIVMLIILAGK